jgi:hypothetical protein
MTISERLAFLVTLDADSAIKGFDKVGAAADKGLGKAQTGVDKASKSLVSFGSKALAVGGLAVAGLTNAANAAGDLGEAVAATEVIFGDAADSILAYGETAADTIGQSNRAALQAAATFGTFGKAAGKTGEELATFSTDLVTLSSDLASFKNVEPEVAVEALGAALRGESEPIRQFGVLLDDATLKQRALEMGLISTTTGTLPPAIKVQAAYAEILAQTTDAQGDFARTADGLANSQRTATARMEDAKAAIGEGFLPILTAVTEKAGSLASGFSDLNKKTDGVASQVLAFGVVGLGAAGALSFLVGKALSAVDTFKDLGSRLRTAEGDLTKAGKAAAFLAKGVAAVAASEAAFATLNELSDVSGNLERKLQGVIVATDGTAQGLVDSFEKLAGAEDKVARLSNLWGDFGKEIKLAGTDSKRNIEDLDRAFDKLLKSAPDQAASFIDALQETTDELDKNSGQYRDNIMLIERWGERLELANDAAAVLGGETLPQFTDQLDRGRDMLNATSAEVYAAKEANEDLAGAVDDTTKSYEDLATAVDIIKGALSDRDAEDNAIQAQNELIWANTVAMNTAASQTATEEEKAAALDAAKDATRRSIDETLVYIDTLGEIPTEVATKIAADIDEGNLASVESDLRVWARNLRLEASITVNRAPGFGGRSGDPDDPGRGKRIPGTALGGNRTGMTWVGERGPELVDLPLGSHVRSFPQLRADISGASGGSTTATNTYNVSLYVAPGSNTAEAGRVFVEAIQDYERVNSARWRAS